jgi:hypothetical protein
MIELNIANYDETSGDQVSPEDAATSEATEPDAGQVKETIGGEAAANGPGLFDLARSISYRGHYRSRVRRSTAII